MLVLVTSEVLGQFVNTMTAEQTVLKLQIWLGPTFSYSFYLKLME